MKAFIITIVSCLLISSCATYKYLENPQTKKIEKIEPYGIFNITTGKNPSVAYQVSAGTVICSVIFFETIVIPVIGIGYELWEPVLFTNTNNLNINNNNI